MAGPDSGLRRGRRRPRRLRPGGRPEGPPACRGHAPSPVSSGPRSAPRRRPAAPARAARRGARLHLLERTGARGQFRVHLDHVVPIRGLDGTRRHAGRGGEGGRLELLHEVPALDLPEVRGDLAVPGPDLLHQRFERLPRLRATEHLQGAGLLTEEDVAHLSPAPHLVRRGGFAS